MRWIAFNPLPPVVQKLDSAIYRINHYPTDVYYSNQLHYPVAKRYPPFEQLGPDQ